jgi:hypothetical protein
MLVPIDGAPSPSPKSSRVVWSNVEIDGRSRPGGAIFSAKKCSEVEKDVQRIITRNVQRIRVRTSRNTSHLVQKNVQRIRGQAMQPVIQE